MGRIVSELPVCQALDGYINKDREDAERCTDPGKAVEAANYHDRSFGGQSIETNHWCEYQEGQVRVHQATVNLVVVQFQEPEVHPRELDSLRWMGVTGEERNDERRKFISSNHQF